MYRGYIEVKDKKAVEPFKGVGTLKTIDEVKELDGYAGVLAEDSILIDVDDKEQAEILMDLVEDKQLNCNVFETSRGMHFVFKNNGVDKNRTDAKLAIGIHADIKIGSRNSYQVLKNNGEERFHSWETPHDEVQQLPKYLLPVDSKTDFMSLEEGDGRNQELFNYILTLQSSDFEKEEVREAIQLMNSYVLSEPVEASELETILRDDAFSDELFFGKNNVFLFDKFANFLKSEHHIKRINGELHVYDNGMYRAGQEHIEAVMIKHIPRLRRSMRSEVISYLNILDIEDVKASDPELILFRNGVLDIQTGEMHPSSPDYIITNRIPHDYNPNAYDELADETLTKMACDDMEIRMLLEEVIGATLYRSNELASGKAFILTGEKSNGKSTYLYVIRNIMGKGNYSTLDLNELHERFLTAELAGKLANIGDDIDNEYIKNTGTFKKLVTGDALPAERKGLDPFQFESFAKLLFSANSIPRLGKGKDMGAIMRRMLIIPFNATFDKNADDYNPFIRRDLVERAAIEYFIRLGVEGLLRVLINDEFTKSKVVEQQTKEYERINDPLISFVEEVNEVKYPVIGNAVSDLYEKYQEYCIRNGYKSLANNQFSKEFQKKMKISSKNKRIDGEVTKVFTELIV